MQKLMQLRLFRLLSEIPQTEVSTSQLKESYDEFALKVLTRLQLDENHQELYYSLGFIQSKLAGIGEQLSGEQEKNALKTAIKAMYLVGLAMQLLEWRISTANSKVKSVSDNKFPFPGNNLLSLCMGGKFPDTEGTDQPQLSFPKVRMTWTGNKSDLVELIYALKIAGCFNHGHTTIAEIASYIEIVFNIDLGEYYHTFRELRRRVKQTAFLDKLLKFLNERMDEADREK